jgi:CRISPR-associated endonuclease/helicase Cas3
MVDARDRAGRKWDRAARYLKIAFLLQGNPEGIGPQAIADHIGVSKRTVYRDLESMQSDAELPIWAEDGKWGMDDSAFLPPLALTLHEAMTLFLAARVLAKTTDEHDTELIGSFVKLASILPPVLAEHIRATVEAFATTPRNDRFTRVFRTLTEAWAARRVVELDYGPGVYDPAKPARHARVRPLAIEPSALTHALYLMGYDEERKARRTFKVERITEASMTPDTFEVSSSATIVRELLVAWDVISDEPPVRVVIRFSPKVAARVAETRWHPSQESQPQPDGSLRWSARVAGVNEIRAWILGWGPDAEVLEPPDLRAEIAARLRDAAALYETGAAPTPSAAPTRRASRTSRPNQ